MQRTPDFARLRKTILRQAEPDYIPLMEFYIHPSIKDEFILRNNIEAPEDVIGKKVVERDVCFWYNAGYDYIPIEISLRWHPKNIVGTDLAKARESLFLNYTKGRGSAGWVELVKGMIASIDDFNRFPWPKADELDYSPLDEMRTYLPESVKVIVQPGRLFQGIWAFMGFEDFCFALIDQPALVEKMFHTFCELQVGLVRNAVQFDCVGAVWIGDDIATTSELILAPKYFRKYLFPWFKEMAKICHERDLPLIYHSDGNISKALDDIIECGIAAIHPIEPPAMDIVKVKKEVGDKLCIIGNIDLQYTLTQGTPQEVEIEVKERIKQLGPGGGYCIGSANSIPDYIPYENYEAMRKAALLYGKYPITC